VEFIADLITLALISHLIERDHFRIPLLEEHLPRVGMGSRLLLMRFSSWRGWLHRREAAFYDCGLDDHPKAAFHDHFKFGNIERSETLVFVWRFESRAASMVSTLVNTDLAGRTNRPRSDPWDVAV
jgi:hypothetical protein